MLEMSALRGGVIVVVAEWSLLEKENKRKRRATKRLHEQDPWEGRSGDTPLGSSG
jgi:hypothetical protein